MKVFFCGSKPPPYNISQVPLENFWEYELKAYTKEVLDEIRKNPKYAECFA